MSGSDVSLKIQQQLLKCEQSLINAIDHTKRRICGYMDAFLKEHLNNIDKSFMRCVGQVKENNHVKEMDKHLLLNIEQMSSRLPEFQKILKARVRIPLKQSLKQVEFSLPQLEVLPMTFNLAHKKQLVPSLTQLTQNQNINYIVSLPLNRLAVAIGAKIKLLDVLNDKIIASFVTHSDRITSLNSLTATCRFPQDDIISLSQKMKESQNGNVHSQQLLNANQNKVQQCSKQKRKNSEKNISNDQECFSKLNKLLINEDLDGRSKETKIKDQYTLQIADSNENKKQTSLTDNEIDNISLNNNNQRDNQCELNGEQIKQPFLLKDQLVNDNNNDRFNLKCEDHISTQTKMTNFNKQIVSDNVSKKIKKSCSQDNQQNKRKNTHIVKKEQIIEVENQIEWRLQNESVLVSTSLDKRCQVIRLSDFKLIQTLRLGRQGQCILQLNQRETLVQQTDSLSIFLDLTKKVAEFKCSHQIIRCGYSSKYNLIFIHCKNKLLTLNKRTMKVYNTFIAPSESLFMRIFEESILIVDSNSILVLDLRTGKPDKNKQLNLKSSICSVTDMLDGSHLALITLKNEIVILDYQTMKIQSILNLGGRTGTRTITYMNDGQHFAIHTLDNKIKLWSLQDH